MSGAMMPDGPYPGARGRPRTLAEPAPWAYGLLSPALRARSRWGVDVSGSSYHSICRWTFHSGKGGFVPPDMIPEWSSEKLDTPGMIELVADDQPRYRGRSQNHRSRECKCFHFYNERYPEKIGLQYRCNITAKRVSDKKTQRNGRKRDQSQLSQEDVGNFTACITQHPQAG